jgi:hypothetical protein
MATPGPLEEANDPSLTLGGPLYRLLRRSHTASPVSGLLYRQATIAVLVCWVPLAILSLAQVHSMGYVKLSFFRDIETHIRFLVSLPVLIIAEMLVDQRIRPMMKRFVERHVITSAELPKFYGAIDTTVRFYNSVIADIVILTVVYTIGLWIWRHQIATDVASWYASFHAGQVHLSMPGYWLALVSVPIFQFILLRWFWQFAIWFLFLFRTSRLQLRLSPLHPDREGGIGFVGTSSLAFAPLLFALSALLSGHIASRILYNGESLFSSEIAILCYVFLSVVAAITPLFLFTPQLILAKRRGLAKYGNFASDFVTNFDDKWLKGNLDDELSVSGEDIQSLADLSNSFSVVRRMRFAPIAADDIFLLLFITAAPFLPLLLSIMPLEQLVVHALKIIF